MMITDFVSSFYKHRLYTQSFKQSRYPICLIEWIRPTPYHATHLRLLHININSTITQDTTLPSNITRIESPPHTFPFPKCSQQRKKKIFIILCLHPHPYPHTAVCSRVEIRASHPRGIKNAYAYALSVCALFSAPQTFSMRNDVAMAQNQKKGK